MMSPNRTSRRRGASTLEFTLVGIPLIFVLISTFELARGMWDYHTLAAAVKDGTRYASLHGHTCATSPNTCTQTVAQITQHILDAGPGLESNKLTLTFTSNSGSFSCLVTTCLLNNGVWPSPPADAVGSNITIAGKYVFQSAISMFWPGAGPGVTVGTVNFPASSRETIQF
jgi:Flp pilus assembly protein TadG